MSPPAKNLVSSQSLARAEGLVGLLSSGGGGVLSWRVLSSDATAVKPVRAVFSGPEVPCTGRGPGTGFLLKLTWLALHRSAGDWFLKLSVSWGSIVAKKSLAIDRSP